MKNKFVRFPRLSVVRLLADLSDYRSALHSRMMFLSEYSEVYKMPKSLTRRNIRDLKQQINAIDVLTQSSKPVKYDQKTDV